MHLIHKNTLEVNCVSKSLGFEIQSQCSAIIQTQLYPAIDLLFQKYDQENVIWIIEQLEINIQCSSRNWQTEIVNQTIQQMEAYLNNNQRFVDRHYEESTESNIIVTTEAYCFQLLLEYIKTGILPANSINNVVVEILLKVVWSRQRVLSLLEAIGADTKSFIRFILLIKSFNTRVILEHIDKVDAIDWDSTHFINIQKSLNNGSLQAFSFLKKMLQWLIILKDKTTISFIKSLQSAVNKLYSNNVLNIVWPQLYSVIYTQYNDVYKLNIHILDTLNFSNDFIKSNKLEENLLIEDLSLLPLDTHSKELFIDNAGIVILHPFLKTLFTQLGYCSHEEWNDIESQHKAVLAMQFLCTGYVKHINAEPYFNKCYCGLSVDAIINTDLELTSHELNACDELLLAVINHWNKLGNISLQGLRTSFLMRNGKFYENVNTIELWVENKGVDVLLDYLPWGIQTIKSPWIDKLILCNWNY